MIRLLIIFTLTIFIAPASIACTGIRISVETLTSEQYDPGAAVAHRPAFLLRASDADLEEDCVDMPVFIRPVAAEPFPLRLKGRSETLEMRASALKSLFQSGNELQLTSDARRRLLAGDTVRIELGEFGPGQFVSAGPYNALLEIAAGDAATPFSLEMNVAPVMRFEMSSTALAHNLNLGDPTHGARDAVQFFYRSNSDMRVKIASENKGRLVHDDGEVVGTIAYRATFSGRELNLSTGLEEVNVPFSGVGVQSRELAVTVPPTGVIAAGRYRDVLSISFTPF